MAGWGSGAFLYPTAPPSLANIRGACELRRAQRGDRSRGRAPTRVPRCSQEAPMVSWRFLDAHRTWQDWVVLGLGVLIDLAPWLTGETSERAVVVNAALIGVLVVVLAEIELVKLRRWPEIGQLVCGLWQTASPYVFGYARAGQLRYWHFALGALVALLAALELWQDRRLKAEEVA